LFIIILRHRYQNNSSYYHLINDDFCCCWVINLHDEKETIHVCSIWRNWFFFI